MKNLFVMVRDIIRRRRWARVIKRSGLFDEQYYLANNPDVRARDVDALGHFLRSGGREGRKPSQDFDSRWYLTRYPDVAATGMNPLVHYCLHGRREQRRTSGEPGTYRAGKNAEKANIEQASAPEILTADGVSDKGRRAEVYISCWLQVPESLHDGIVDLALAFESQGVTTRLLTNSSYLQNDSRFDCVYGITTHALLDLPPYRKVRADGPFPIQLDEVINVHLRIMEVIGHKGAAADEKKVASTVRRAYSFWKSEFVINQPKLIFIWGSTSPLSRLHILLCRELSIEYVVLERGHFPKTVSAELIGQFAYGGSRLLPPYEASSEQGKSIYYESIERWVREQEEVPYAANNADAFDRKRFESVRAAGKRLVLFIGVNDSGSGVSYERGDTKERHALVYKKTRDAFVHVLETLRVLEEDTFLIFKPHPADRHNYGQYKNNRFVIEPGANINDLITVADICVTLSTTALARCVIEEKPIVTMALTDLSGRDIAYECNSRDALPCKLRAALNRDGFERKRANGYRFIESLFEQRLFGVDESVPTRRTAAELGRTLARRVVLHTEPELLLSNKYEPERSAPGNRLPQCRFRVFGKEGVVPHHLRNEVDIVIPIYRDAEITKRCIESVINSRDDTSTRVMLICDASPEREVVELVDSYKGKDGVHVFHNAKNIGFVGTANRGIELAEGRDVILLNSDAIVPGRFGERLKDAAYTSTIVATATPFSNNAGLYSVPLEGGAALPLEGAEEYVGQWDLLAQERNGAVRCVEMPIGHGFCMYIKRMCIDRIGYLDEAAFGRGYFEEVDFCLRARRYGYVNGLVPNLFVGHVGHINFGGLEGSQETRNKNREIISEKWPEHFAQRSRFLSRDPIRKYRPTIGTGPLSADSELEEVTLEIIGVTYDHGEKLKCFINSIKAQRSRNWRLHIVHDGIGEKFDSVRDELEREGYLSGDVVLSATDVRHNDYGHSLRDFGLRNPVSNSKFTLITNCDNYYAPELTAEIEALREDADLIHWDCVHSHVNSKIDRGSPYGLLDTRLEFSRIDIGAVAVRTEIAREIGFNGRDFSADWTYIDECMQHPECERRIKVAKILFVHN